ncbi:alpha/beta hydrolase [Bradyrhizobium liaoningense]|uniref:alpha/beta hydrolase n=1 Tax=Bradyrhizobium liaoningense TaxID=43992 RepID=UPI001BAC0891|nr:alpha/beta hydrolase [Bradyrhizobium liaoningense]MBR0718171.1 alpha/beta hydrolase [Bradyrhizobium liaoningense]
MTVLKWIAIILAAGYLAGLLLLYVKQRAMLFPIPTAERTAPAAAGLSGAEEHVLTTSDGEKVIVWHLPPKPGRPVILFFHGNGDSLAGLSGRFRRITADGTGLVALSYRGYAGSSGAPTEDGLLRDGAAAYSFAAARYEPQRLVLWGFSLGTGVAVALASEHPIGRLILEAPYTSLVDVAASHFRFVPVRLLMRDRFHSDERIASVTAPLLIMHGALDQTIPIAFGERLFTLAREPKRFVRIDRGGHNDLDGFGAIEAARRFIDGN